MNNSALVLLRITLRRRLSSEEEVQFREWHERVADGGISWDGNRRFWVPISPERMTE